MPLAVVEPARRHVRTTAPGLVGCRIDAHLEVAGLVVPSWDGNACDGERMLDALVGEVHRRPHVRGALPHPPALEVEVAALVVALEIPIPLVGDERTPFAQRLGIQELPHREEPGAAVVASTHETHSRIEAGADLRVAAVESPLGRVVGAEQRDGVVVGLDARRPRPRGDCAQLPVCAEPQAAVEPVGLPARTRAAPVGGDEPQRGTVAEIPAQPGHREVVAVYPGDRLGAHVQEAEIRCGADLARDPYAGLDRQAATVRGNPDPP